MSTYYTLTGKTDAEMTAQWTYRTTLDPVLSSPRSRVIAVAMLRHAREHGWEEVFLSEWRSKRQAWLADLTRTQRRWQRETRRPSHARHHDSIATRERYVRLAS